MEEVNNNELGFNNPIIIHESCTNEPTDFSLDEAVATRVIIAPLNNSMAKSKIRAASKKKPTNFGNVYNLIITISSF